MNFARGTVLSSPYVGIFCTVTDEIALVPYPALPKEVKEIEKRLEVEIIRARIGNTSLLGVLSKGIGKKIAVSGIAEESEIKAIEKRGLEVMRLEGLTSTGNLLALNGFGGVASDLISEDGVKRLEKFFRVKFARKKVAESSLPGAALTVTNKGFIAHPNISAKEFSQLEKSFGVKGGATTANYGDFFVGNSVLANSKGVIAGRLTTGIELSKIDEALRGE
ncbi:MAG TPA: translation initiation factor IF-6 [archaeon]|nr:translation initiation factor IF-6 [archaeon]